MCAAHVSICDLDSGEHLCVLGNFRHSPALLDENTSAQRWLSGQVDDDACRRFSDVELLPQGSSSAPLAVVAVLCVSVHHGCIRHHGRIPACQYWKTGDAVEVNKAD
jgi:hypothetical protein